MPSLKLRRYLFAMVSIQNQLISIQEVGGYDIMETIQLIAIKTWNKQSRPFSVNGHCAVTLDIIIVIGGRDENHKVYSKCIFM